MDAVVQIRKYIEENGLKQVYVARKAGIDEGVFNAILCGRTKLSVERLQAISKALDKKPEFFLN